MDKLYYTEKQFKSDIDGLKNFFILKYDDEDELSINVIENGKHAGHMRITDKTHILYHVYKLNNGEKINALGRSVECVNIERDFL